MPRHDPPGTPQPDAPHPPSKGLPRPVLPTREDDPTDRGVPVPAPDHYCRHGWLGLEDNPRPCPECRPWLARETDATGNTAWRPRSRKRIR